MINLLKHKEILDQLSVKEKASLMSGKDFWQTQEVEHAGIPSMFLADGPHGIRKQQAAADHLGLNESIPATCFPPAATVANSWDVELGQQIGEHLGVEAVSQDVNVLLGPGINMKRNPLCGRNFEYFSEDPYHAGKLAASYIKGIQSQGVSACVKHFAVNNQEERRMSIDTVVDERTLREIYLTAFEIAVKEGNTQSLMSSYNKLNGTYTNEHPHLMQDILREEWGYEGVVVTDWGGSNDRVEGLRAGNELEMPTANGETVEEIIQAIENGELEEAVLDQAVDRLIELILKTNQTLKESPTSFDETKHHQFAQKVAEESIVLLKNKEDILPISKEKALAVVGDFAQTPRYQGAGSSIVNPTKLENTLDAMKEMGFEKTTFAPGFDRYGKASKKKIEEAVNIAKKADVVLLYLGLDEVTEAEGLDREDMKIPQNQLDCLEEIAKVNDNIVVVLSSGAAVELPWINKVKAVVHGYLLGQAGAKAKLRVLTGEVNPSGKLAETYPLAYKDTPSAPYFPGKENSVEYKESLFIGYRYFDTRGEKVLFPFGYGLSYTDFAYSDLQVDENGVEFTLTNTGLQSGSEIAQLYVGVDSKTIFRPKKELKGFKKIHLESGESKKVRIPFDDYTFRYYNVESKDWEVESGEYKISIGASSQDVRLETTYNVEGTEANHSPYNKEILKAYFSGKIEQITDEEFQELMGEPLPPKHWDRSQPLGYNDTIAQMSYAKGLMARLIFKLVKGTHWFLRKIGKRETANLIMMSVYHMPFRGIARMTGGMVNMPMVDGLLIAVNGQFFRGMKKVFTERRKMIKGTKEEPEAVLASSK